MAMIREIIPVLLENNDLGLDQARVAMREIMSGEATPAQTAAFLVGLKTKGETVEEVTAMAEVMRDCSRRISPKLNGYLLDTCGTGGGGAGEVRRDQTQSPGNSRSTSARGPTATYVILPHAVVHGVEGL